MRYFCVFWGLMAVLAAAPVARGADASGTWKGAFDFQGRTMPLTIHLTRVGAALTGAVEGLSTTPVDIHDGKIDGNTMSFWVSTGYQGENYRVIFKGQASTGSDEISFNMATDDGSWSAAFTAKRSSEADAPEPASASGPPSNGSGTNADLDGTWKGSFDFNGNSVPVTFHFARQDGAVTGTLEGIAQGGPSTTLEIHDGKLQDGMLTFWVNTNFQGEEYKLLYTGKIEGKKIDFNFGTDDGSWNSPLVVMKQD